MDPGDPQDPSGVPPRYTENFFLCETPLILGASLYNLTLSIPQSRIPPYRQAGSHFDIIHTSKIRSRKAGFRRYSYRKASTGLAEAALTASMPTVSAATTRTKRPAARKTHMPMVM